MSVEVAGNQLLLKGVNRMAVVRGLCRRPGLSRSDLSDVLGLTRSTVTTLVRQLLAEGWLMERQVEGTGDIGRRPTPLFIDPHRLLLLGCEVGLQSVQVVATALTGDVLTRVARRFDPARGPDDCLDALSGAMLAVFEQLGGPGRQAIGIGVGLPGGVDTAHGMLRFAPNLGWRNVPVAAMLAKRLRDTPLARVAVFLQNEADAAAMGEFEFNGSTAASPLLYLSINQGLGAGVVVRDKLLSGSRDLAGEVGHIVLEIGGPLCSCGRRGCAEALISAGAASGVPEATGRAGFYLGVLLQNLTTAYDPGCIVLGGEHVALGDAFLGPALQTLRDYAAAAGLAPPDVRISQFGADAVAIGAAALARHRLTRPFGPGAPVGAGPTRNPIDRWQEPAC